MVNNGLLVRIHLGASGISSTPGVKEINSDGLNCRNRCPGEATSIHPVHSIVHRYPAHRDSDVNKSFSQLNG